MPLVAFDTASDDRCHTPYTLRTARPYECTPARQNCPTNEPITQAGRRLQFFRMKRAWDMALNGQKVHLKLRYWRAWFTRTRWRLFWKRRRRSGRRTFPGCPPSVALHRMCETTPFKPVRQHAAYSDATAHQRYGHGIDISAC
jgi:hypothetical protein